MGELFVDPPITETFGNFISTERHFYDGEYTNRVMIILCEVERYIRFVEIIAGRYQDTSDTVSKYFWEVMEDTRNNPGKLHMTPEEIAGRGRNAWNNEVLHLEIESFFIFAKILLDKIAHCMEAFFGSVRGCSLKSHDELCKCFDAYVAAKGLAIPPDMVDAMIRLRGTVAVFRDKSITHLKNPRLMRATHIVGGETAIGFNYAPRKDSDHEVSSPFIAEVLVDIGRYADQFARLIEMNRGKARFSLKQQGDKGRG